VTAAGRTPPKTPAVSGAERRSLFGWFGARRTALTLILALPVLGAATGAALKTPLSGRYRAVATLITPPPRAGEAPSGQTSKLLAGLVRAGAVSPSPEVVTSGGSSQGAVGTRVTAAGGLEIIARGRTSAEAEAVANSVAAQLVSLGALIYARAQGRSILLGNYDGGVDGWNAFSKFSIPPSSLTLDHLNPRFGKTDLVVNCAGPRGCGIAHTVPYTVIPGIRYTMSVWVRGASAPIKVALLIGRGPSDYTPSAPVLVPTRWTRLSVGWTPRTLSSVAELDVQRAGGRGTIFAVGAVSLTDPTLPGARVLGSLSSRQEQALFATDLSDTLLPARAAGVVASSVLPWTAGGLLAGLLLALAGLGAGRAAAQRQR